MYQDKDILPDREVNWKGVRPIYKKLSDEFHVLLSAFDITIDDTTKIYLDHLICCIDRVDDILDGLADREVRLLLSKSMIQLINGDRDDLPRELKYPALQVSLLNLRWVAEKLSFKVALIEAAKVIFTKTEDKRHVEDIDLFIQMVQEEGKATATLPLLIIGALSNEGFTHFFTRLCRLMGVADMVADARSDYKSKIISFKPTLRIYIKLIGLTLTEGIQLLMMIPHKFRFVQYCFRFSTILWKSK